MNDSFTKEQILAAYNSAPDFVRATFNDEATTQIVMGLQARFKLHVDSAGILAREVGYLLLGLVDPSKFADRLKSNNFPDQIVNGIVTEINQKIFVPLREKMRSNVPAAPQQTKPMEPVKSAMPSAMSRSAAVSPSNTAEPREYFHLENKLPSPLRPVTSATQKPIADEKLLEDHEEPHIEFNPAPPKATQGTVKIPPLPPPTLPGVPRPSESLGGGIPPPIVPKVEPFTPPVQPKPIARPILPVSSAQSTTPIPPSPPTSPKSYSLDPYREPIDTP